MTRLEEEYPDEDEDEDEDDWGEIDTEVQDDDPFGGLDLGDEWPAVDPRARSPTRDPLRTRR